MNADNYKDLLNKGLRKRVTAETKMNERSRLIYLL